MSEKTFKVAPGEEIDIFIRRPGKVQNQSQNRARPKGIIDPFPPDEFLPRRMQTGGMELFDCAITRFGETEVETIFSADANIRLSGSSVLTDDVLISDEDIKKDAILATDLEDFEATFRQITRDNIDDYLFRINQGAGNVFLDAESEFWSGDGKKLKLDAAVSNGLRIYSRPDFDYFELGFDEAAAKVTIEPDFSSDAVEFTLAKNAKIFLLPSFASSDNFANGALHDIEPPDNAEGTILQRLYNDYQTFPKLYFKAQNVLGILKNFSYNWLRNVALGTYTDEYRAFYENIGYLKGRSGARHFQTLSGTTTTENEFGDLITTTFNRVTEELVNDFVDQELFPYPPDYPASSAHGDPSEFRLAWASGSITGTLAAIVKQAGNVYYVWQDFG